MLAGADHGISKANIVTGAAKDLDLCLSITRERMRAGPRRGYNIFGVIETIYFEPDVGCTGHRMARFSRSRFLKATCS
jgi:hypothetical protein